MQSVYGLTPLTERAQKWVDENVNFEPWQLLGLTIVLEHRYIDEILEAMVDDGLEDGVDFEAN